jgi:hypothetical protein
MRRGPTEGGTEISDRKLDDYSGLGDATPEYLDRWTATQAAPKAPQRKRPCRSRALSLILTVRSLNCASASPDQGLVAFRITLMAIHSKHLETLEAVIATALNILKNRPLADLYVRRDFTGDFRIRIQLESGQRYVITIREER